MTTTETARDVQHAPASTRGGPRRLILGAGLLRGAWMFVAFGGLGMGIVVLIRWLAHWHPILATEPLVLVAGHVSAPLGFASSARTSNASIPPARKKKIVVTRYWTPITLWSVLTLK